MKRLVRKIYEEAPKGWDGEFMALDDHIKDKAVMEYIFAMGIGTEVFPECCSGAEIILTHSLYSDPIKFFAIYDTLVQQSKGEEAFLSEAVDEAEAQKLMIAYCHGDALECAKIFGDAAYKYCENSLREWCADEFDSIQKEMAA